MAGSGANRGGELQVRVVHATSSAAGWQRALFGPGIENGFLSMVAHELRVPVTALATSSELLARDLDRLDQPQIRAMVSAISLRSVWLRELLENLLYTFSLRDGRLSIQPVQLLDVIREAEIVVEPLLQHNEQRLRLTARSALPSCDGNRHRLGQVMVNLLSNASKFGRKGTTIDVSCTVRGDRIRVSVADHGPGLGSEPVTSLFEPFRRGMLAHRAGRDGLGLGLAIVKGIVEAHGGRVGGKNRRAGGACFWFELPCRDAATAQRISGWKQG